MAVTECFKEWCLINRMYFNVIYLNNLFKCQLVYYEVLINAFYVYLIIKMPALLVLSVNNRYTGLIRVNINNSINGVRKKFFSGGRVIFKYGGEKVNTISPLCPENVAANYPYLNPTFGRCKDNACYFCFFNTK